MKHERIQRETAKVPRRGDPCRSLAPGFSQVPRASKKEQPFQRLLCAMAKPLKWFVHWAVANTRLQPGVNEISQLCVSASLRLCVKHIE
ncbi:MAG TPA: hypothetical protein PKN95_01720 [Verrucomicrobiota bacterium]|nr:hypothetical protein [Verrucomicrobiota bacterium]HNT13667.1 hypothetical protein [Verrucomicrobiota bacterium]